MHVRNYFSLAFVLFLPLVCGASELTFERDIRPIFRAHCFDCHGAGAELEGELDLRLVRSMLAGGESGPAIEPGQAASSFLLQRIKDGEMPPGDHRVPDDQINVLERWIAQGALTARPEPAELEPGLGITPEERDYWAFQPIRRPPLPSGADLRRARTPVDVFLLARMEPMGLTFAPDADKPTLISRAYLDLIGLPPTPAQVDSFVADDSADAWSKVIDQLLESPLYGERWGRHWLDVAGYADSEGASNRDPIRPWAFKYRDWVIRALNENMPFDQFITWQLAGDELAERPLKNMSALQIDQLTATGFLRMAADGTATKNDEETRNQVVSDTIKIVSSSLLGLSVGCAQCHDHRYDPISQVDYYRLRAIFEPALDFTAWLPPAARRVSLMTEADRAFADQVEAKAKVKVDERTRKQSEFMEAALQKELGRFEETLRARLEQAYRTPSAKRNDEQKRLLADHPSIGKLHAGVLYQYNQKSADKLKELDQQITQIRGDKPKEEFVRALVEPANRKPPVTKLFHRGDHRQPKQEVKPGGLAITASEGSPFAIGDNDSSLATSGRRLAYARWLTNGRHPLVARVLVNRFWLHHFGQALVSTPDEFGQLGSQPTHPALLNWLAQEFMAGGWDLKSFHRLIMLSTVYQQESNPSVRARQSDRTNRFYSSFPIHRLEAEAIRDAILFVSGRLDTRQSGPAVPVAADDVGQIIVKGTRQRRSVYLQARRTQPVAILKSFDAPAMEVNCARRESSTASTQSLMLMNSQFILDCASAFAARIEPASEEALELGWRLAYGRNPTEDEARLIQTFYDEQCRLLDHQDHKHTTRQALTNYCQSLLTSNEFLYVE